MACPALPLCGLAIGEGERGLPDFIVRIRTLMTRLGMPQDTIIVRMTGCPNGCSRPYMAELGFVADGANTYQVGQLGTVSKLWLALRSPWTLQGHQPKWPIPTRSRSVTWWYLD